MSEKNSGRVIAEWSAGSTFTEDGRQVHFSIEDLHDEDISFGADFENISGELVVGGLAMWVDPKYRRNKYATRMTAAMGFLAAREGMQRVEIDIESPYYLKIFSSFFEEDSLMYIDRHDGREYELPMSTEQAISSLERASEFEDDLDNRRLRIEVHADMSGLRRDLLEEPLEDDQQQGET